MQLQIPQNEFNILRTKVPLEALGHYGLRHLPEFTRIQYCIQGDILFRLGEQDKESVFLLNGEIELVSPDGRVSRIGANDQRARYALGNLKPRRFTCSAASPGVVVARIQSELLERVLTWEQMASDGSSEIVIMEGDVNTHDWLTTMISKKEFHLLPVTTLETLLQRLEEIHVEEGTQIIRQGQPGDFYYIMANGRALVQRDTANGAVPLAELTVGQSFGEQALITGFPRNANVIALEDSTLKRLSASDFKALLLGSLIKWVNVREANSLIHEGAIPVDVRTETEFEQSPRKNVLNIPLFLLHLKVHKLKRDRRYILFCDNGARSSAAAFLLSRHHIDAYVLRGGLASQRKNSSPA